MQVSDASGTRRAGTILIAVLAVALVLVTTAAPGQVGTGSVARTVSVTSTVARTGAGPFSGAARLPDGSVVVCAAPADCGLWADALAQAEAALDPWLPAEPPVSDLTVVAPTTAGQAALLGVPATARPAATTLVVDQAMVASGLATADQRGRTWIVVNPDVARTDGDLPRQVLTHELVHARTRAAVLDGPLWVEEGYAVALTHRVLGPSAGPVPPRSAGPVPSPSVGPVPSPSVGPTAWPSDDWVPRTLDDYGIAGQAVTDLAARIGWVGVARWYAASEAGAGSLAAARAELARRDIIDGRG
ncbi:hypothetical protein [Raineyella sp.]|uniref:hypothetical protein n=1 Tax=Raineyella sp. TaxID=1911550 RepID=UPI002B216C0C|nr:hypothetical protein [Raineyella sp.]MEA5155198.1 hypothetical protein [Raineyella sp.]